MAWIPLTPTASHRTGLTPALRFPLYRYSPSCGGGGWGEPSAGSPLPPNTSHPWCMAPTLHPQRSEHGLPCLDNSSQGSASHAGHGVHSDSSSITTWHSQSFSQPSSGSRNRRHRFSVLGPSVSGEPQGTSGPQLGSWDHGTHCTPALQSWDKAQIPSDMQNV